jgi:DnaJ family protein C protein 2
MLGLEGRRWRASLDEVQAAYKRVNLRYHPDKCGIGGATPAEREKIEHRYKLIQDAHETLTDPAKRRMHDSTDLPDAKLASTLEAGDDFFAEFGPGFASLERFSERTPVPSLGGPEAPYAEVDAFYSFWGAFKSWREFPHPEEEDTELANSREHKREMERKNAKLREKAKKEESVAIKEFVRHAHEQDPRVRAAEAAAKAEKAAAKAAKGSGAREAAAAKAAAEAAEKAAAEAAAKAAADEREAAKKGKEAQRKAAQREKKRLRSACEPVVAAGRLAAGAADVETLCTDLPIEAVSALAAQLEAAGADLEAQVEALTVSLSGLQVGYRERAAHAKEKRLSLAKEAPSVAGGKPSVVAPWAPAEV